MGPCLSGFRRLISPVALVAAVLGCAPRMLPGEMATPPIRGTVRFGERSTSATTADIAVAATVSLINPTGNITVATTLTDGNGKFELTLPTFKPAKQAYYLEAIKGLQSNLVGFDAARLRTILSWTDLGWDSIYTNDASIGYATTALAAIVNLRSFFPSPVVALDVIGKLNAGPPEAFTPSGTGITQAEFGTVRNLVATSVGNSRDPIASLVYDGSTYTTKALVVANPLPFITAINPDPPSPNTLAVVSGGNFEGTLFANKVWIDAKAISLVSGTTQTLTVSLPGDATSGTLKVVTSSGTASTPIALTQPVGGALLPPTTATPKPTSAGTNIDGGLFTKLNPAGTN